MTGSIRVARNNTGLPACKQDGSVKPLSVLLYQADISQYDNQYRAEKTYHQG
jgi:hypothetical protein